MSQFLHGERSSNVSLSKEEVFQILSDVRRTIYALEKLCFSKKDIEELKVNVLRHDKIFNITEECKNSEYITGKDKKEINNLFKKLEAKGLTKEEQDYFIEKLNAIGGKIWEMSQPLLSEISDPQVRQKYNL